MKIIKNSILYIFIFLSTINTNLYAEIQESLVQDPIVINGSDKALKHLMKGNKTFIKNWHKKERKKVAQTQHPFAIILTCSDSRVSPEIIFHELHLGSLFIVRNAGNVADKTTIGSIEYGIEHLHASLIIVLGHERCGAVTAAVDSILQPQPEASMNIKNIIDMITPAVNTTLESPAIKKMISSQQSMTTISEAIKISIITESIQENVKLTTRNLYQNSKILATALDSKKIKIVGAYYDLDDGIVHIIN